MKFTMGKLFCMLPEGMRFALRRMVYLPKRLFPKAQVVNGIPIPNEGAIYTGGGDFVKIGASQLQSFRRLDIIHEDACVLNFGSGIGRVAIPLAGYLSSAGDYYGFDVVQSGVDWCVKNISARYPNFHFQHIALQNDLNEDRE